MLVHKLRKLDLASAYPRIVDAGHHDQRLFEQHFWHYVVFGCQPEHSHEPKLDASRAQSFKQLQRAAHNDVKDDARILLHESVDVHGHDSFRQGWALSHTQFARARIGKERDILHAQFELVENGKAAPK